MTNFKAKCTKFDFGWDSAPDPAGELTVFPRPLAGFGAASRQGRGWAGEEEGKEEGRERENPKLLLNQGPSESCYATDKAGGCTRPPPNF